MDLSRLNANQREAVLHAEGPLLVLAGAGSGKTSTMAYRIAHLIAERKLPAFNILGLSFTNKAAGELKERVRKLVTELAGPRAAKGLTITTFHSLCVRLLRAHADLLGFQTNFTIVDQNDQRDILKQIFKNVKIDDRKFDHDVILFEIGQAKNRFMSAAQAQGFFLESGRLPQDYAIAAATSYEKYQAQLKLLNAMDFDDLLFYGVKLLERADVKDFYGKRFRQILVDEYQDTNPTQFRLLSLLTAHHQNICVVGDDDQSIYGWRGADSTHILEFTHHYPAARVITLDQNYRSTNTILEAANQVIANNKKRHPKKLWSTRGQGEPLTEVILEADREEAEFVATEILKRSQGPEQPSGARSAGLPSGARGVGLPWKDFAILYRSNAQSRNFEEALRRNGVPYKIVGGMSFLDRKEVKDALSYWRLIVNPRDDASLRRVLNWPARGIGASSIEAISKHAFDSELPLFEVLPEAPRLAPRAATAMRAFYELIHSLRRELEALPASPPDVSRWARSTLDRLGVKKAIEEDNEDPVQGQRKWENVDELVHSIGQFLPADDAAPADPEAAASSSGITLLREFLTRMTLEKQEEEENKNDSKDSSENQVTLLTLHGAKGLEFPIVFLVGMEDGYLPHQRTIDGAEDLSEERRLAYVGITRARDHLILTRSKNRIRYGKPVPRNRSRFLDEVPKDLILVKDDSYTPDLSSKEARQAHEEKVSSYLGSIREMLMKK